MTTAPAPTTQTPTTQTATRQTPTIEALVTEVLATHPGVVRAATTTVRHEGRDVVVAAVEPSEYLSGLILRDHVERQLGGGRGPAGVLVVDELPTTSAGVLDAGYLAEALADGRCTLFEDPHDDVERRVAAIWAAQMDVRSVGVHDDFLELGGDSLSALGIIAAIETEFDRSVDVFAFMSASTVRQLAAMLR